DFSCPNNGNASKHALTIRIKCFIRSCFRAVLILKLAAAESRTLMDKSRPSRKQRYRLFRRTDCGVALVATGMIVLLPKMVAAIALSHSDALKIGKRVWQNECNGTISGLTAWNKGEDFASLGIGHFIWYPKGRRGPFEESFPKLVIFVSKRGAKLPT